MLQEWVTESTEDFQLFHFTVKKKKAAKKSVKKSGQGHADIKKKREIARSDTVRQEETL
jgi:hypothetical protein